MKKDALGNPTRLEYFKWLTIPIALYVFVVIAPIVVGFSFSLTNWSGSQQMRFIGFRNYMQLFYDGDFWKSFENNVQIIAVCLVGQVLGGFLIALLLSSRFLRPRNIYRFIIFLPVVLSGVVVASLWQIVYNSRFGLLNWFLRAVGLGGCIRVWLDNPSIVMNSISAVLIWQFIGENVVIFLASLQNIPTDILESAELNGASGVKKALYITMPLMKDTIKVVILLCITGNMKIFDHIWLMTRGGPGTSSSVLAVYAYKVSFEQMRFGYGAAASIGIMVLSALAYFVNRFRFRGRKLIYFLFIAGMMIPVHGFLVPLYIQFSRMGMTDKWYTLLFPLTAFNLPFSLILAENFLKGIPIDMEESSMLDGATLRQRIFYIVLPMCQPIISTLLILNFLWTWNDYPFALTLLSSDALKTLPLGISNFKGEKSTDYPTMFAALTLVSLPVIAVYSAFSNRIMEGMTAGAVKG